MTYFLVMGSLALSVLFTFGWALSRLLRWAASGFSLGGGAARGGRKGGRRSGATRSAGKAKAGKAKTGTAKVSASRSKASAKPTSEPWRITRLIAEWRSSVALALVASLIYLVARLAEYGISYRPPHTLPSGFDTLLIGLGWLSAGLILLALLQRLAAWRCR
ncbi:hypothetical protein [Billgrantia kenyensis]|uniref:Uncharacterized protein n=1 Tax=Billgrantia kenyensis TaxID=321266 RepID=A0A7V9W0U2_9GAMM|nr:hypothetical protein [Halomonas kenyensis]MBA2778980.1 hypothetical protein [Halomonas kenyensis]MCG6662907.1 hypothetical protein [Halomonas kenyensis]